MITMKEARELIKSVKEMRNTVTDEQALTMVNIFPKWKENETYKEGTRLTYNGVLYKVILEHTTIRTLTPDVAKNYYIKVIIE